MVCGGWRPRGERGFLVIEAVVALAVLGLLAAAAAQMVYAGYAGQRLGRMEQTATAVADQVLETARQTGYGGLAMSSTDLSSTPDPMLTTSCPGLTGTWFYAPGGSTPCETVVVASGSGPTVNATPFNPGNGLRVRQYVTWVDAATTGGPGQNYKRVTTRVFWSEKGRGHTVVDSTMVSPISIGHATRAVTVAPANTTAMTVAGGTAVFTLTVTNTGTANDYFNPSVTLPGGSGWSSQIYLNTNGSGSPLTTYGGTNPLITDTNYDGVADTGSLGRGASVSLIAAVTAPSSASGTYTMTVALTSAMDPSKSATATVSITVNSAPVATAYYLHNAGTQPVGPTSAQLNMPLDTTAPTGTFDANHLPDLSGDIKSGIRGRYLTQTSNGQLESGAASMADWILRVPSHLQLSGNVTVQVWAQGCKTTGTRTTGLVAYLGIAASGADSMSTRWLANSGTPGSVPAPDCTPTQSSLVTLTIPAVAVTLGATDYLELKIVAPYAASGVDALLGYDGASAASTLNLRVAAT